MAAGKHGGYRDDEYRTDFGMSKKENGYRKRGRRRRECERGSVRKRNIREREVMNGGYGRSSRGGGGRRRRRCEAAVGAMDREPSKLVSDAAIDQLSTKKRKFSPILWDRDDREISRFIKSRSFLDTDSYSQSPGLVKSYRHENVQTSGAYDGEISPEASPDLSSEFRAETDGYVPVPSLISCRWAKDAESPADEGEISDCEHMAKLRRKSSSELGKVRGCSGSISLEVEVEREGSEGTWGKSLRSDICGRSSSRDTYCDNDHNNDSVEIDDDHSNQGGASVIVSETESDDDSRSLGTQEPAQAPQRSINILQGCRSVDGFEKLAKVGEGTYGIVYRARDKKTGEIVALKKIKMLNGRQGIPLTSLREITILLSLHHPSIVDLKKVIMGSRLDSILMVMEYMEHDLKALLETMKQPFSQSEVKCLMLQLLEGVECLHDNFVLHRDLKTSNLLLNNRGELKICDFGLARKYGNPLRPYTQMVVTLWYRAPELLLGAKEYSTAIDMWSVGCIMAELLSKEPLFNGKTELDQLGKIFRILGTPNETIWPGISKLLGVKVSSIGSCWYNLLRRKFPAMSFTGALLSDAGFDLLNKLLTYDPEKRITAKEALNHEWFREVPLPKSKEFMPTFPAPCTR